MNVRVYVHDVYVNCHFVILRYAMLHYDRPENRKKSIMNKLLSVVYFTFEDPPRDRFSTGATKRKTKENKSVKMKIEKM